MQEYREGRASVCVCVCVCVQLCVHPRCQCRDVGGVESFTGVFIGSLGEANVNHVTPRALFEPRVSRLTQWVDSVVRTPCIPCIPSNTVGRHTGG